LISVGNDIISLKSINTDRTRQERFYSKFLVPTEIGLYNQTVSSKVSFENFVWLIWSVKESVYKCHKRNNTSVVFSPKKIIVEQVDLPIDQPAFAFTEHQLSKGQMTTSETSISCEVIFENIIFYSRSFINQEMIHTIAVNQADFSKINFGAANIKSAEYESQHREVRSLALDRLKIVYPNDELQIGKSQFDYPILIKNGAEQTIPLSFSHHDEYVGYCFWIE
jgi:phosphopantetheine--protein transferase-like protein